MKIFFVLLLGLSMTGCLMTREDMEKEDEERQLKEQVTSIQKSRADNDVKYGDLEGEIRAVSGHLETVEHIQQVNHQLEKQELDSQKKTLEALNERLKLIEQHLDTVEAKLNSTIQAMASGASAPSSAQVTASGPADTTGTGKKADGKVFSDGEALLSKREYKKALVKYQAYREKFPKGPKAAEATYKIGLCLGELGLKKEAREIFQETIESYPGTPSAKKARFRLTQLK